MLVLYAMVMLMQLHHEGNCYGFSDIACLKAITCFRFMQYFFRKNTVLFSQ